MSKWFGWQSVEMKKKHGKTYFLSVSSVFDGFSSIFHHFDCNKGIDAMLHARVRCFANET